MYDDLPGIMNIKGNECNLLSNVDEYVVLGESE